MRFANFTEQELTDSRMTLHTLRVLGGLKMHADSRGQCWPTQGGLAAMLGMHRVNVSKAMILLREWGYIVTVNKGDRCFYQIVAPVDNWGDVADSATGGVAESTTGGVAESATSGVAESATQNNTNNNTIKQQLLLGLPAVDKKAATIALSDGSEVDVRMVLRTALLNILEPNPEFKPRWDVDSIERWLGWGCDPNLIVKTVKNLASKGAKPNRRTLKFYDNAVQAAHSAEKTGLWRSKRG